MSIVVQLPVITSQTFFGAGHCHFQYKHYFGQKNFFAVGTYTESNNDLCQNGLAQETSDTKI